jgi:hypothetical protein
MKKAIVSLWFLFLTVSINAQEIAVPTLSKDAYLKKSRVQKVIGWAFLAGGIALYIGAAKNYEIYFANSASNSIDNSTSTLYGIAGTGAFIGGIISFRSARKNKRMAMSVTIKKQELIMPPQSIVFIKPQPSISLNIPLR